MHRYAAKRAMDGSFCHAPCKRSEDCRKAGGDDGLGEKADIALRLPGQASSTTCRHAGQGEMGVVGGWSGVVSAVRRPGDGPSRA